MASPHSIYATTSLLFFLSFQLLSSISRADVPASATFTYVNQGEFGEYIVEYDGNYRTLPLFSNPFQICFYNTTPNAFTLALRMGTVRSEALMHWVWEANRGNPVRENATFTLGRDGNLVLADADGRVAWQTNTANKGVVGFQLLPTGNMVLHDGKGKYTRGDGATKQSDCERKCTKDCKCMGYFYQTHGSRCWIAYDLKTLTKVGNTTHLAYIKTPNK